MIDTDKMVEDLIPKIEEQITKKVLDGIGYTVEQKIREAVLEHVDTVVLPLVRDQLATEAAEHGALLVAAAKRVTEALAERVEKIAIERLAQYDGQTLVSRIMGDLLGKRY